jgi:dTDP-4-dehydrorhamnose 3,5-epimerase-like enzyme
MKFKISFVQNYNLNNKIFDINDKKINRDNYGYFYYKLKEEFNEKKFEELTEMNGHFVQDKISKSSYGVLRGLHLQKGEYAQAKLVSCLEGKVWDIADEISKTITDAKALRKSVIDRCVQEGINQSTASVQFGKWKNSQ